MPQHDRSKASALKDIETSERLAKTYAHQLHVAVQIAKERGATWEEIGEVLGVSRQAAHERFGKEPKYR